MAWFQKKDPGPTARPKAGPTPKGLKVAPLLSEDVILFPPAGQDKNAVLSELVAAVARKEGLSDGAALLEKVQEREQGISTTLDTGLSLPHARVEGLERITAGMAVLKAPITDPKHPDLPIRAIFLFFSPNKREAFPLHLQLLRGVSSLFQAPMIEQLSAAPDAAAALKLVRALEG